MFEIGAARPLGRPCTTMQLCRGLPCASSSPCACPCRYAYVALGNARRGSSLTLNRPRVKWAARVAPLPRGGKLLNTAARLASVGIELALSIVIGLLGGRWLDGKLGTAPWLMIAGLLLGVFAGFRSLIRTARKAQRETQTESKPNEPE